MNKVLASHQPDFFPYMGYFYKMFRSNVFVFSDDVQYSKGGRHNYNTILTANGPHRLTLPVSRRVANLNEIQIAADDRCLYTMLKTIWLEYKKAPHFSTVFPIIEEMMQKALTAESLADFNHQCIMRMVGLFGMAEGRRFYLSSDLKLKERKDARIIEMCKLLDADVYYSGVGAKDYHVEDDYRSAGIQLVYSDYQPVIYPQVGRPATENMSVIDYVMNCGFTIPGGWTQHE